jgi:hypothetical protein
MLIDIHKFWAYDNRESLSAGGGTHEEEEEGDGSAGGQDSNRNSSKSKADSGKSSEKKVASVALKTFGYEGDEDPYDF